MNEDHCLCFVSLQCRIILLPAIIFADICPLVWSLDKGLNLANDFIFTKLSLHLTGCILFWKVNYSLDSFRGLRAKQAQSVEEKWLKHSDQTLRRKRRIMKCVGESSYPAGAQKSLQTDKDDDERHILTGRLNRSDNHGPRGRRCFDTSKIHPWQGVSTFLEKVCERKEYWYFCPISCRELLLNNNLLRVLPYELGRLFQLQTLGLKGESFIMTIILGQELNYIFWITFWPLSAKNKVNSGGCLWTLS